MTRSLHDLRNDLTAIVRAGIAAADAGRLVERALASADWRAEPPAAVVAAGKAAPAMAAAAARTFGGRVRSGLLVASVPADAPAGFRMIVGGHPLPDAGSVDGGRAAVAIAESVAPDERLLVLLSGGASAILALPADGVTLDDLRATTAALLQAGADIHALNTVRKHLSALKGGWLAARTRGGCRTLAVSDVVGDALDVIASGPTVADATTFAEALDALQRFGGEAAYPPGVTARLRRGALRAGDPAPEETPKPGDRRLGRAVTRVIGSRRDAMAGAAEAAATSGYEVAVVDDPVVGEARVAGVSHVRGALARAATLRRPACVVSSGETTVRVVGHGRGGRNQELALAAAGSLAATGGAAALASVGTDGVDGPTDAAGAVADSTTLARARAAGLAPERFLAANDAYAFFDALGDLIFTGPTGTNVGDLQIILLA